MSFLRKISTCQCATQNSIRVAQWMLQTRVATSFIGCMGKDTYRCISCMSHKTDPRDPASHTIHISSVAYNTLFLEEFMQPDSDMFHEVKKVRIHDTSPETLTTTVRITDIDSIDQVAGPCWKGEAVIYAHRSGSQEIISGTFSIITRVNHLVVFLELRLSTPLTRYTRSDLYP
ncbi:hypothetical protein ACET3Z_004952 [Daucus carota]